MRVAGNIYQRSAGVSVNQRKILLVEDNPTDEALLMRALQKSGITNPLVRAKDGLEAIQYLFAEGRYEFRDPEDLPAIVLVDLNLPKMDGLEILFKHIERSPPIAIMPSASLLSKQSTQPSRLSSLVLVGCETRACWC